MLLYIPGTASKDWSIFSGKRDDPLDTAPVLFVDYPGLSAGYHHITIAATSRVRSFTAIIVAGVASRDITCGVVHDR
ncbi:MAG: hypothetical protein LDL33_10340 [Desulfomonile sp.]|nr:hypothetical protein [Desulfomonile sp.]